MKNLKKVLALVLAFACAFTMFAGAAFTDSADIKTGEAVNMLTALGVIDGYEDGSFKPEATITRAEAAKMIFTIRNGGNDNASAFEGSSVFTDVYKGHWAAGYINFCYANGIVDGKAKNAFKPDDKVTGTELAKMLLICMGYQADKSGLTGAAWSQKTNGLASQNGLYDDVTASVSAAMPRQYAAQIMYNALDADTVQWSSDIGDYEKVTTTGLEWKANPNNANDGSWVNVEKNETMGKKWMKLDTREGNNDNPYILTSVKKEDGRDTYEVKVGTDTFTRVAEDYSDLMGQDVKVLTKDNDTSKVYGISAGENTKVVASGSVGVIDSVSSDKIKLDGTEYKKETSVTTASMFNDMGTTTALADLVSDKTAKSAWDIKLIDNNGNGKIDRVVVTPKDVKEVTYVGKTAVTAGKSYKLEDTVVYDGIAKDDWAVIVAGTYAVDDKTTLTKAEEIEGKVAGIKGSDPVKVQVDGTWYTLVDKDQRPNTNDTVTLVVVGSYAYDCDATTGASKDILYLSAKNTNPDNNLSTDWTIEARAYFTDGTNKKIVVDKLDGNDGENDLKQLAIETLYTYKVDSDGNYELTTVKDEEGKRAGYDSFIPDSDNKDIAANNNTIDGKKFADDAVVFVKANKEIKVISGKTVRDWSNVVATNNGALIGKNNNISYVKVAALTVSVDEVPGASGDSLYAYVVDDSYETTNADGDTVYTFKVWNGSKDVTLYSETDPSLAAGVAIEYTEDGEYVNVKSALLTANAIIGSNRALDDDIQLANGGSKTIDKDATVIAMDDKEKEGAEGGVESLPEAQKDVDGSTYIPNAYVKVDGDKVLAIVYDAVNNELDEYESVIDTTFDNVDEGIEISMTTVGDETSVELKGETVKGIPAALTNIFNGNGDENAQVTAITIKGLVPTDGSYTVAQTNEALSAFYPNDDELKDGTKDSSYTSGNGGGEQNGDFSLLIKADTTVKLEVKKDSDVIKTVTIDTNGLTIK